MSKSEKSKSEKSKSEKSKSEKSKSEEIPAFDRNKYRKRHIIFGKKSNSSTSSEEKEKRKADLKAAAVKREADLIAEVKREADLIAEAKHKADLKTAAEKHEADLKTTIKKMKKDVSKILGFFSEKEKSDIKSITKDYDSQSNANIETESLDFYISKFIQLKTDLKKLLNKQQISVELEDLNQRYSKLLPNLKSLQEQISNIEKSFNYFYNINFIHLLWGKFKLFYFLNKSPTKEDYIDETKFIKLFVNKGLMLKSNKNKTKKKRSQSIDT